MSSVTSQRLTIILEIKGAARCEACGLLSPMPGLRVELKCFNCSKRIDVRRVWGRSCGNVRNLFGAYYDVLAEAVALRADGGGCHDERKGFSAPLEVRRVAAAACLACGADLPLPTAGSTSVTCPKCSDAVAVRWPDDETRAWDQRIACVLNDGKGRGAGEAHGKGESQGTGVVLSCGSCHAPMVVHEQAKERRRSRTCEYCGAANFLSDGAWLSLFPQAEAHRFFLVYELDARQVLALFDWMGGKQQDYGVRGHWLKEFEAKHARARVASRPAVIAALFDGLATAAEVDGLAVDRALTDAEAAAVDARLDDDARQKLGPHAPRSLVLRWMTAKSAEVRRMVADLSGSDVATLTALAADADPKVRACVAARRETPAEVLARLRKDPDAAVSATARKNPSYEPGFIERLLE